MGDRKYQKKPSVIIGRTLLVDEHPRVCYMRPQIVKLDILLLV